MDKPLHAPGNSLLNVQGKDTQLKAVFNAFYEKPRTMKEVFVCTGVLREFVCWYCRELRLSGRIAVIRKRKCSITGYPYVNKYTGNPNLYPKSNELKLF